MPLEGQEAVGEEGHRRVVVEAGPTTSFEVVKSELVLELQVAPLHLPALLPPPPPLAPVACRAAGSTARTGWSRRVATPPATCARSPRPRGSRQRAPRSASGEPARP